jgi:hypothetical protein
MGISGPPLAVTNNFPEMLTTKPCGQVVEIQMAPSLLSYFMRGRMNRAHGAMRIGRRMPLDITDRAMRVLAVITVHQ